MRVLSHTAASLVLNAVDTDLLNHNNLQSVANDFATYIIILCIGSRSIHSISTTGHPQHTYSTCANVIQQILFWLQTKHWECNNCSPLQIWFAIQMSPLAPCCNTVKVWCGVAWYCQTFPLNDAMPLLKCVCGNTFVECFCQSTTTEQAIVLVLGKV